MIRRQFNLASTRARLRKLSQPYWYLERLAMLLPPRAGAFVDRARPGLRNAQRGPLNGQVKRQAAVRDIFSALRFDAVVETGTHRGASTQFFSELSTAPVFTIEINERYYRDVHHRFRHNASVVALLGDSVTVLRQLPDQIEADAHPFFYLDAHSEVDEIPVAKEMLEIARSWPEFVIMIDDFKVPHDDGYAFGVYGEGREITQDILPLDELPPVRLFWPAAPSTEDTGAVSGWLLVASVGAASDALANLDSLIPDEQIRQ